MPSRKITEVKQELELANVEKGQRSDHQHTEIWGSVFTHVGGGMSVKGGSYVDYLDLWIFPK